MPVAVQNHIFFVVEAQTIGIVKLSYFSNESIQMFFITMDKFQIFERFWLPRSIRIIFALKSIELEINKSTIEQIVLSVGTANDHVEWVSELGHVDWADMVSSTVG